jgi:hypothetical protein
MPRYEMRCPSASRGLHHAELSGLNFPELRVRDGDQDDGASRWPIGDKDPFAALNLRPRVFEFAAHESPRSECRVLLHVVAMRAANLVPSRPSRPSAHPDTSIPNTFIFSMRLKMANKIQHEFVLRNISFDARLRVDVTISEVHTSMPLLRRQLGEHEDENRGREITPPFIK